MTSVTAASAKPGRPAASVWVEAARPRTLSAAVAPVLVGTAAATAFVAWRFAAALVVALAVQVAVNYANDYSDGVRGVDTAARAGPRRVVAAGLVPPATMQRAIAVALAVAAIAGVALAAVTTWWLLAVGAAAFAAAIGYSGGPRPYASAGLGEAFVFAFFGLVATVGSAYVQDQTTPVAAWWGAVGVGLLAVAILLANNLRDLPTDAAVGKRTLSVRIGDRATRAAYAGTLLGAGVALFGVASAAGSPMPLLGLVGLGFAGPALRRVGAGERGRDLVAVLVATSRAQLAYGVLVAGGLVLARTT